jgi:hypothetical protein
MSAATLFLVTIGVRLDLVGTNWLVAWFDMTPIEISLTDGKSKADCEHTLLM